jgi:15-cis-phytoene synthase
MKPFPIESTDPAPAAASPPRAGFDLPPWLLSHAARDGASDSIAYMAEHSRSFRFATRFLPPRRAREVAEIYAFCRFTDDLVDRAPGIPADEVETRLDQWEALVRRAYAGDATGVRLLDRPIGRMAREGVPLSHALDLIEGMRMDVRPRRFGGMADLEVYTYRVAGVVGKWLAEMSGVRHPGALARAADLGHAMQLTNILRDVGEDWERGRLYLPMDALARHGLDESRLDSARAWNGRPPQAYCDLMEEMMALAERRYRSAFQGIPALPAYFQRPVLISAMAYRGIHDALRRNGYDNFRLRACTTPWEKLRAGAKAFWLVPSLRQLFSEPGAFHPDPDPDPGPDPHPDTRAERRPGAQAFGIQRAGLSGAGS